MRLPQAMKKAHQPHNDNEGLPPLFKTWKQMYLTLVVYLGLVILLLYGFSLAMR